LSFVLPGKRRKTSRVQPAVKKKTECATDNDRADEGERQLQGKRRLRCKIRGLPLPGSL
jgi:hypothetical protein